MSSLPQSSGVDLAIGHADLVNVGNGLFAGVWLEAWEFVTWLALFLDGLKMLIKLQLFEDLQTLAQARPKTTKSRSELAPRRLAPWTEAQAVSPAA